MSLQNICEMFWNFALFDTIFSVVDIRSHCNLEMAWKKMITRQTLLPSPSLVFYSSQTLHLVQFALCFGGKNRSLECLSA